MIMNQLRKIYTLFIILFLSVVYSYGQYYESGQDPTSLKWKQIKSPNFQIIFPESFSSEGQRLANILEYAYTLVPYSLNHNPKKIPVIVHSYSAKSNGFVSWAPKRMELFPTPMATTYPQDELEQLVLHELRHVVQLDKLNQGFTKVLSYILGQQAIGAVSVELPLWYLEGDAVATETSLSRTGRGRQPSFGMGLRALSLEKGKVFKYDKASFGSYKDFSPDYYEFGYQLVSYSRSLYGSEFWEKAVDNTGKKSIIINPINFSFRKQQKLTKKKLYDLTFRDLQLKWMEQDQKTSKSSFDTISQTGLKHYTSFRFPQYLSDSVLLVQKSGMDQIRKLVKIDQAGEEEVIFTPGFYYPVRFSASKNFVVWAETYNDSRWENRSYSIIKKLDLRDQNEKTLARRTRYFAPDISPDEKRIATVDISVANECSIAILDLENGNIQQRYSIPGNNSLHMPEWVDDKTIIVIVLDDEGKSIQRLNLDSGDWEVLLPASYDDIQKAVPYNKFIIYHATYSGIDNIYALDTETGQKFQVTSSRFGAMDVTLSSSKNKIAVADYSSDGFRLMELPLNPDKWIPLEEIQDYSVKAYEKLKEQEKGILETKDTPQVDYKEVPFRKWKNLFGFHSWMPFYFDYNSFTLDDEPLNLGVTLLSQNKLSTAVTSLGYYYKNQEHHFVTRFTYKGWYPIIDLFWDYGGAPQISKPDSVDISYSGYRSNFNVNIYIPLNLTRNKWVRGLYPEISGQYTNSYIYNQETGNYDRGHLLLNYRLYFYNYLKLATKDIKPRLGFLIDLNYTNAPFNSNQYGSIGSGYGGVYLPGFFRHHTIFISGGLERQNVSQFLYSNRLSFPSGYDHRVAEKLNTLYAEYYLPLFYPELNIGGILYVPRFYAKAFYNYAKGEGNYYLNNGSWQYDPNAMKMTSFGGQINMNFYAFRFPFPFSFGVQYSYMPSLQNYDIAYSFGIDFFGFTINKRRTCSHCNSNALLH